jgi:hypothetical protein
MLNEMAGEKIIRLDENILIIHSDKLAVLMNA